MSQTFRCSFRFGQQRNNILLYLVCRFLLLVLLMNEKSLVKCDSQQQYQQVANELAESKYLFFLLQILPTREIYYALGLTRNCA
jgi:uncharacterized membrane protein affecting hemolysin expression